MVLASLSSGVRLGSGVGSFLAGESRANLPPIPPAPIPIPPPKRGGDLRDLRSLERDLDLLLSPRSLLLLRRCLSDPLSRLRLLLRSRLLLLRLSRLLLLLMVDAGYFRDEVS